jgi:uncharacterized protein YacL
MSKVNWSKLVRRINWFGVIAGVMMLIIPFTGAWWNFRVGTGAIEVATAPYYISVTALGQPMSSDLTTYITLGVKISIILAGVFLLLASLFVDEWWSKRLFKFGALKVLWSVIGLIVMLVIMSIAVNKLLPNYVSQLKGFSIPTISGSTTSVLTMSMGGSQGTVTIPISMGLTGAFGFAVVAAVFGVLARIYHRRLVPPEEKKKEEKEKKKK